MTFEYPLAFNAVKLIAVITRIGAFTMAFPIFTGRTIPGRVQTLFVVVMSVVLFPVVPDDWLKFETFQNLDVINLCFLLLSEAFLGLLISIFVMIFMELFQFAGYLIDRELGYGMANIIDPLTEMTASTFLILLMNTFTMVFLITDGHHEVIRMAAYSFETIPPGRFYMGEDMLNTLIVTSTQIFVVGFQIAMPVFAAILLVNIAMSLMARIGEDFPVMMLSFPAKFALGFIVVAAIFPTIVAMSRSASEEMLEYLSLIVRL